MSKQFRFAVIRKSIIEETFFIEADSEEEALGLARDGNYKEDDVHTEWVEWYDEEFSMDPDLEPEPLCPLYQMVKAHECATS